MKALLKSGLCAALGWLASSAGAQEPVPGKPAITLSQPTPLNTAPTPAPSFRVMSGAPPATVRAQQPDERIFQIEPLLEPGDPKTTPQPLPKDKSFVPPPPAPLGPTPIAPFDSFGGTCCADSCGTCGPRLSGLRGWGGTGDPGERYQVWASAEYLMWWQKGQVTPPLVVANVGGTPTAQTGIIGPGTAILYDHTPNYNDAGGRFGIGAWLPCFCNNLGVELNYFFLARQSSTAVFNSGGDPTLSRPFFDSRGFLNAEPFAIANTTDVANGSATVHDFTQLWGFDANLRYKLWRGPNFWLDALAGYRYLNLTEGIDITEDRFTQKVGGIPLGLHTREVDSFHTTNQFSGVQLGLDGEARLWDRWFVGMNAKLAMGSTNEVVNITGASTYTFAAPFAAFGGTQPGGLLTSPTNIGRWTQTRFAVAPEVGFKIGYDVTDHLRLFAGYDFLYLSSVMRPGDQIDLNVNQAFRPTPTATGLQPGFGNFQSPLAAGPRVPTVLLRPTDYWAQGLTFGLIYRY